ncbi:MAG TPA: hypothetical protein VF587_06830 [Solirubrobacteraceae bacterium]
MRLERRLPWIVLAAVMALSFVLLMHAGRDTTFYLDDWPVILNRREWSWFNLLRPHVDHLQIFPLAVLKLMFETVGLHDYWVYRALLAVLDILVGVLLFLYGRKRIGPWPSIALAACLVLMAPSWFNLLYAFQINFVGGMAGGLAALLLLERGTRRSDVAACVCLTIAIGCNGVALPFMAAVGIEILLRGDRWRRIWVPAIPGALYLIWRAAYGHYANTDVRWQTAQEVPRWLLDGADDSAAAMVGMLAEYGPALVLGLIVLVVIVLATPGRLTPRFAGVLSLPIVYFGLTGIGRANEITTQPDENRFLYAGGLMLALVGIEAAQHLRWDRRLTIAVTAVLVWGAALNANAVENGGNDFRGKSLPGKYGTTALDIAGTLAPPHFNQADPTQGGEYLLVAGPYLQAVADYGSSPGYTREELLAEPDQGRRRGVDDALLRVHGMRVAPVAPTGRVGRTPPKVTEAVDHTAEAGPGCVTFTPDERISGVVVELPLPGLVVRGGDEPAEVRVRRFSRLFGDAPLGTVEPGAAGLVRPAGPDKAPEPFTVEVRSGAPVDICAAG